MRLSYKEAAIFLLSISSLIIFFYFTIIYSTKKPFEIINFIDSNINKDFEVEITNNLNDINNYLKEYLFIESHVLNRRNNEINIKINLNEPFAINYITKEVIFYDNIKASLNYFKVSFLNDIDLIDISKKSLHINKYLIENYKTLSSYFDIKQIEYIDDRRYNLVLSDGKIIMLPKVIDSKLLYFIENNIDLIEKNTNYEHFLDLRNFHNKTIRLK